MDLKNANYFSVDGSIADVWERLDAGATLGEPQTIWSSSSTPSTIKS